MRVAPPPPLVIISAASALPSSPTCNAAVRVAPPPPRVLIRTAPVSQPSPRVSPASLQVEGIHLLADVIVQLVVLPADEALVGTGGARLGVRHGDTGRRGQGRGGQGSNGRGRRCLLRGEQSARVYNTVALSVPMRNTHVCSVIVMMCDLHPDPGHTHLSHSRVVPVLDVRQVEDRVLDSDGAQRGADLGVGYGMCVGRG